MKATDVASGLEPEPKQTFRPRIYKNVLDLDISSSYPSQIAFANISKDTTVRKIKGAIGMKHEEIKEQMLDVLMGDVSAGPVMKTLTGAPDLSEISNLIKQRRTNGNHRG